jgi:PAS domain S-box-containing protein
MVTLALGNCISQMSNTVNNIIFYKALLDEKASLQEKIQKRTKELEIQKEELQLQKEELETIFNTSKDGIAILDLQTTHFLEFNDAYAEMLGFPREELILKSCLELSASEDYERAKNAIQEVLQNGYLKFFEKSCFRKDGKKITVNMSISLMPDKKKTFDKYKRCFKTKRARGDT